MKSQTLGSGFFCLTHAASAAEVNLGGRYCGSQFSSSKINAYTSLASVSYTDILHVKAFGRYKIDEGDQ